MKNCYDHIILLLNGIPEKFPALLVLINIALCLSMFLEIVYQTTEYAVVYPLIIILIYVSIISV